MEAVIATGGKQYCVTTGQVISVEKLPGDKGAPVEFKSVLLVNRDGQIISGEKLPGDKGAPVEFKSVLLVNRDGQIISGEKALSRAKVSGEVVSQGRRRKVRV